MRFKEIEAAFEAAMSWANYSGDFLSEEGEAVLHNLALAVAKYSNFMHCCHNQESRTDEVAAADYVRLCAEIEKLSA